MGTFLRDTAAPLFEEGLRTVVSNQFKSMGWFFDKWMKQNSSSKKFERDYQFYGIDVIPQSTESDVYNSGDVTPGSYFDYTHITYKYQLRASKEAVEDELYGQIKKFPAFLAKAARHSIEIFLQDNLNSGFGNVGYDGVASFAINHPGLTGVRSNKLNPDVALGITSLKALLVMANSMNTYEGHPMEFEGGYLAYPPNLDPTVFELLKTEKGLYSAEGTKNYLFGSLEPMLNRYLTSTSAYFILPKISENGFLMFWRVKVNSWSDVDPDNEDVRMRIRFRLSGGCNQFEGALASDGTP